MIVNRFPFPTEAPKIDISGATVTQRSVSYSGSTLYAKDYITVKYNGVTLQYGVDYTLSGTTSAKNADRYTIYINGIGAYTGTKQDSFMISKGRLTIQSCTASPTTVNRTSYTAITFTVGSFNTTPIDAVKISISITGGSRTLVSQTASKTSPSSVYNVKANSTATSVTARISVDATNYSSAGYSVTLSIS